MDSTGTQAGTNSSIEHALEQLMRGGSLGDRLRAAAMVDAGAALQLLNDAHSSGLVDRRVGADVVNAAVETAVRRGGALSAGFIEQVGRWADGLLADRTADLLENSEWSDVLSPILDGALARSPHHPRLLRAAAERAVRQGDPAAQQLLTAMARADGSPALATLAYRLREQVPAASSPRVRIALLSSFTIDPLVPFVDLSVRELGLIPEVYVAPFNSWTIEMLNAQSELRRFAPEVAFLSVSIDDLVPELADATSEEDLAKAKERAVSRVTAAVDGFFEWSEGTLVVHSMHSAYRDPDNGIVPAKGQWRARWIVEVNDALRSAMQHHPRGYLLDINEVLLRRAGGPADNPKMRHLASMRIPEQSLRDVAGAYARYVAPLKGFTRKCVVLDLDNTLWGGVVGEDGPSGIRLGHASPGVEFQDFQHYLRSLTRRGFILAVASKNNPDDALEVIRSHEGMILRETDFAAVRINWRPKPENLASIAEELNIGLDSFIFVDDNPDERELMRQLLPQVMTVEMPRDPARYREALEALPQLQTLVVTSEDLARTTLYRANRERELVKVSAESLDTYLASLGIGVEISRVSKDDLARVHQLFQRTNQFNTTTRRYDAGQLTSMLADPSVRLIVARARDKFGDHGLVAVALGRVREDVMVIDSFLMSCRVIGYGVESTVLADLAARARSLGATQLVGEFIETRKNVPARDFYERHGFTRDASPDDAVAWFRRSIADDVPLAPSFVTVTTDAS